MLPKTDLCFIEGSLTGLKYAGNILHSIIQFIAGAVGEVFIFIDDNARFHRARIVNETFESKTIQRMNRPSLSPDLNPIEHDWNILQQRNALQHLPALPQNQQEPPNALQEEWQQIPQASLAWIMGSIGRRCGAVTDERGDHVCTKY